MVHNGPCYGQEKVKSKSKGFTTFITREFFYFDEFFS